MRTRALHLSRLFLLLAMTSSLSRCTCGHTRPKPFNIHDVSMGPGVETTVAVVPDDVERRTYVIGYNGIAWSVSADQGATWARHNASDPGFEWGQPAEIPGEWRYGVDPTLVLTGHPKQVAFLSIAFGQGSQVAIALSKDGGVHFGNVHLVSSPEQGNRVDEPVAALNAQSGDIWVAWTQAGPGRRFMVRSLRYDASGDLTFGTPPIEVKGLPGLEHLDSGDPVAVNATIAAGNFKGLSHVAVAYADKYEDVGCPTDPNDPDYYHPTSLNYYLAESTDGAHTWQTVKLVHDPAWPQCVTENPLQGHRYNRNRPAIVFGDGIDLFYYAALTRSSPTGSLVHVYRVAGPIQPSASVLDFGSTPPDDHRRHDQFGPAIAAGYVPTDGLPNGRAVLNMMVTWHDTRADANGANLEQLIYGSVWGVLSWEGVVSEPSGGPNEHVPWIEADTSQSGPVWGDYEGLAADDTSHAFVAAWADNRLGGPAEVWSAVLNPIQP